MTALVGNLVIEGLLVTKDQEIKSLKAQLQIALHQADKLVTITKNLNLEKELLQRRLLEVQNELQMFRKSNCDIASDSVYSKQTTAK